MSSDPSADQLLLCDALKVHVLIDNVSDLLSSIPGSVTPHAANVGHNAVEYGGLCGECLCCATWGLALGIEMTVDGRTRHILFDAGPDGETLARNAQRMRYDFTELEGVVLSHGHWDHAGGLLDVFKKAGKRGRKIPFYSNEGMFVHRGVRRPDGSVVPFRDPPSPQSLESDGAAVVLHDGESLLAEGVLYLSGPIPRVTDYEIGFPGHVARNKAVDEWRDDPLILDERWVAVRVKDKGIVVFSACSHAGVINVLQHARAVFDGEPLYAVMGGFHLAGPANEAAISQTVKDLGQFGLTQIIPGHCTGWRAVHELVNQFGDLIVPSAVGQTHNF